MGYFLEPLIKLLDQILRPDQHQRWILDDTGVPQIESLLEKAIFLRDYLENSTAANEESMDLLEDKIRDAVQTAEDIIESHIADRFLSSRGGQKFTISPPDLKKVIDDFDSAKEEMMKITDVVQVSHNEPSAAVPASGSDLNPKKIFVGFSEDLTQIKDRVTDWSSKLEVIPIVGMGGIGKTALARNIYEDPAVASCFDVLAWITISQEYTVRGVLLGLLDCMIGKHTDDILQKRDNALGVILHQKLMGRKYLIVLDDMWHPKAWDDVMKFFPNEPNGSRIILTTRETNVATYVDPKSSLHQMHLLNEADSWELLKKKVFSEKETCSPEYEKLGIRIANSCRGLPLAIHVIGGLLSHSERTKDSWEQVANDVSSTAANKDEQFAKILLLSYNYLSQHLKPCFLYMSAFPEDYVIQGSRLIRLWVAEGFLKPMENKSLEEAAEVYLTALVGRNLIFVRKQEINGKAKTYGIHDLLRDLCVKKARQKKFLYVKNRHGQNNPDATSCLRRVSVHTSYRIGDILSSIEQMSLARTFICMGSASRVILSPTFLPLRLLKELDVLEIEFPKFPDEILQLVNLRYLAFTSAFKVPKRITRLENLQTLAVRFARTAQVSPSIFNMPQLRHINFIGEPAWFSIVNSRKFVVRKNLQTLSSIVLYRIVQHLPNLKKLGIFYGSALAEYITDLTCLPKLKTLSIATDLTETTETFLSSLIFPHSLTKLSMSECKVPQTCIRTIGMLPNLVILKLRNSTLENPNWEANEGEFCKLQFLLIENVDLVKWKVDQNNFPRLRHVTIRECSAIEEVSTDLGEIPTLEIIEVDDSSPGLVDTVRQILEEQRDNGNEELQVRITASSTSQ